VRQDSKKEFILDLKKTNRRNHLKSLNLSVDNKFDYFDPVMAQIAVNEPAEFNLNPLFLNTRAFNNQTEDYQKFKALNAPRESQSTKRYGKSTYKTKSKLDGTIS
jgi:hypothetical protein